MADKEAYGRERSSGVLLDPVLSGLKRQGFGDITHLMWPTYKRITSRLGGDVEASLTFTASEYDLEYWLWEGLGQHFEEDYLGQACFQGRLHTVRASLGPVQLVASLDRVFNKVACYYTSVVTNTTSLTQYYEDALSQAQWGTRVLHIRPSDYLDQGEAEETAQKTLAALKQPKVYGGAVKAGGGRDRKMKLVIKGYPTTLDGQRYNEPSTGTQGISSQISNLLSGSEMVTEGRLDANSKAVSIQAEYRPILQRIHWLAEQSDTSGNDYYYGCFGGRELTYRQVKNEITYAISTMQIPIIVEKEGEDGSQVPAPLVRPDGWGRVADVMSQVPFNWADPLSDFRAMLITTVAYDKNGAEPQGPEWGAEDRAHSIQMKIVGKRG